MGSIPQGLTPMPMFDVKNFLQTLTSSPGVYQMLDHQGKIIYVGSDGVRPDLRGY